MSLLIEPSSFYTDTIIVADFNLDNHKDLIVLNRSGVFAVCRSNGKGQYSAPIFYSVDAYAATDFILIEDLNHDQLLDAITFVSYNTETPAMSVHLQNSDQTYTQVMDLMLPFFFLGFPKVILDDVNNDGHPDFLTIADSHLRIAVLLSHGNGTFDQDFILSPFPNPKHSILLRLM